MIDDRRAEGDLKNNIVHIEVPFGKPIEEVYDGVHDGPVLGSGISGLVRLATHKATGAKYAVKCLDLGLVETDEGLQQLREEIAIMCQLDHPNIVRLEEVYESHNEIYLVQELCLGGELFDRLDEQPDYHYTEAQCARLVKQMLCSVRYIHSKGIIHRDLKLENFLFSSSDPDSELKMIDFGLSKHFKFGEVQHEAVGTPYTVAPEVIKGSYDERCDVWAIGVITFLLLSGEPPFGGCGGPEPLMQVRQNILSGDFKFEPEDIWLNVSKQAKDFIYTLLVTDPNSRPTARECQKSSWVRDWTQKNRKFEDNKLNPNVVKALVNFKEYSDMRKLLCEVLSFTLLPDQITDLRKEFEKLDTDGSGEISLSGLKKVLMQNAGAGSLGALTEEEVEDIFNAMRVGKSETRIHWHEFIAAGLSQCKVDERNLRLAFDRLDSDHKGYITFDNVMDLMGTDAAESEDSMRRMWGDSMQACQCQNAQITYEDFLLLMKGQTKDDKVRHSGDKKPMPILPTQLDILHEVCDDSQATDDEIVKPIIEVKDISTIPRRKSSGAEMLLTRSFNDESDDEGPLMMDDGFDESFSSIADNVFKGLIPEENSDLGYANNSQADFTPPQTPKRSVIDFITPTSQKDKLSPESLSAASEKFPLPLSDFSRRRSRSVDDQDTEQIDDDKPLFAPDVRRAMALPEHDHTKKDINTLIKDETKTPLVVNRQLYRAHRQMRLAVLEASKRFEEQQIKLTKERLRAQREANGAKGHFGAGLVMRHGHSKELSSESVRKLIMEKQKEQQTQLEKANRRGGRGRRTRKKTISDMSGMMACGNDEMFNGKVPEQSKSVRPPDVAKSLIVVEPTNETELHLHDTAQRKPTVPGQFRKTYDPFSQMKSILELDNADTIVEERSDELATTGHSIITSTSDGKLSEMDIGKSDSSISPDHHSSLTSSNDNRQIGANASWPAPPRL